MSLTIYIENAEPGLIQAAHRLGTLGYSGGADVDGEYEKYSLSLKHSLAGESARLASKAGVSEKAAFLTLMQLLDN